MHFIRKERKDHPLFCTNRLVKENNSWWQRRKKQKRPPQNRIQRGEKEKKCSGCKAFMSSKVGVSELKKARINYLKLMESWWTCGREEPRLYLHANVSIRGTGSHTGQLLISSHSGKQLGWRSHHRLKVVKPLSASEANFHINKALWTRGWIIPYVL